MPSNKTGRGGIGLGELEFFSLHSFIPLWEIKVCRTWSPSDDLFYLALER
ncbi:hypothetical protein M758_UG316300 [Ceratodon purpureus]|nr:hypothetical protein M758_UG316300 [Ceratodon purpureus]